MDMLVENTKIESTEEEDDDDDGPPPGFQCIINPQPPQTEKAEANYDEDEDEDDDDGPPPGFDSIARKPSNPLPSSERERCSKEDDIEDDGDEGPPPGWEFCALSNALPTPTSNTTDIKMENNEDFDEDEGPPPGWETVLPRQMQPPRTPPLQSSSSVSSSMEIGSNPEKNTLNDDELPTSTSQCKPTPTPVHSSPPTPPPLQQPSSSSQVPNGELNRALDAGNKVNNKKVRIKRPTFGNHPASNPRPSAPAPAPSSSAEKAQLVCGICRNLCLYPRGAKWVKCPGCQEVNFVLEAHEVGQVKCGGCAVLLMYPHGAPAAQCTSCRFVTEIGAHNRRPPLSVQQAQKHRSNRAR